MQLILTALAVASMVNGAPHRETGKRNSHRISVKDDPLFESEEMLEAVLMASDLDINEETRFREVLEFLRERFPYRNDLSLHSFAGFAVKLPESIFLFYYQKNKGDMESSVNDLRQFFERTWKNPDKEEVAREFADLVRRSRRIEDEIRQSADNALI